MEHGGSWWKATLIRAIVWGGRGTSETPQTAGRTRTPNPQSALVVAVGSGGAPFPPFPLLHPPPVWPRNMEEYKAFYKEHKMQVRVSPGPRGGFSYRVRTACARDPPRDWMSPGGTETYHIGHLLY